MEAPAGDSCLYVTSVEPSQDPKWRGCHDLGAPEVWPSGHAVPFGCGPVALCVLPEGVCAPEVWLDRIPVTKVLICVNINCLNFVEDRRYCRAVDGRHLLSECPESFFVGAGEACFEAGWLPRKALGSKAFKLDLSPPSTVLPCEVPEDATPVARLDDAARSERNRCGVKQRRHVDESTARTRRTASQPTFTVPAFLTPAE